MMFLIRAKKSQHKIVKYEGVCYQYKDRTNDSTSTCLADIDFSKNKNHQEAQREFREVCWFPSSKGAGSNSARSKEFFFVFA